MSYCNLYGPPGSGKDSIALQYRKRYELLQQRRLGRVAVKHKKLQYRKRYELLQHLFYLLEDQAVPLLLQYRKRYELLQLILNYANAYRLFVTIPQAV